MAAVYHTRESRKRDRSGTYPDPISALANQLGEALGARDPWVFLSRDQATGEINLFSNQSPDRIPDLLRECLRSRRAR